MAYPLSPFISAQLDETNIIGSASEKVGKNNQTAKLAPWSAEKTTTVTLLATPFLPKASSPEQGLWKSPTFTTDDKSKQLLSERSGTLSSELSMNGSSSPSAKTSNANTRVTNPPTIHVPRANAKMGHTSPVSATVQPKPYTPKPGTWASMAATNDDESNKLQHAKLRALVAPSVTAPSLLPVTNNGNIQQVQTRSIAPNHAAAPTVTLPISSDWRNQIILPLMAAKKHLTPENQIVPLQPPPPAWPKLGDFPPPPGSKPKDPKQTKSMGAWGKAS